MNYENVLAEADDALSVLLSLNLSQDDIDSLKSSVHHAICYGHISPLDGAVMLSALNEY
jgi:hypothetical protein